MYNVKTYSFHISLLELFVCKFGGARPNLPCLAQWIRPQCIRMHFNISAIVPAPPTALPSVLNIRTQMSQSTTASQEKGGKEEYYQVLPLLPSIFGSPLFSQPFCQHWEMRGERGTNQSEAYRHRFSVKRKIVKHVV